MGNEPIPEYPLDAPTTPEPPKAQEKPATPAKTATVKTPPKPAAAPPASAVVPFQQTEALVGQLLNQRMSALQNFLGSKNNALKFMSAVMNAVRANPKLLECNKESLMGAFMEAASLDLYPSNYAGDCWIIPYHDYKKNETFAQFQIGYKGLKTLAYRSGVPRVWFDIVCEKDGYQERRGTNPFIEHNVPMKGERGNPYRAYACADLGGGHVIFESMSKEEIMQIKALSQGAKSKYSPWNSDQDPMFWMWKKTAFKQLAKSLPTSAQMTRAINLDNISERGGYIDAEGSLVEVPFGDPDASINEGNDRKQKLRAKTAKK